MESGRKFVVLNRPASGESSHSVFGLDIRVLRMLYTLAVCYLLFRLRGVLLLPVLSIAAAYILLPAVDITSGFLTHKRHKGGALARVFLIVLTILFSVGGVVACYAFQQPSTLAQQVPTLLEPDVVQHIQLPKLLRTWDPPIRRLLQNFREAHGRDLLETLTSMTVKLLATVGSMLSLLVIFVFSFLLLKNGEGYVKSFVRWLPEDVQPAAQGFFADMHRMMLHWTRAIVLVALATVLLYGIAFSLLRVSYSVLLALMASPFEFVPLIGPPAALAIIQLMAFFSGYHHLLWLVVVFVLARMLVDYVLQPMLMGSTGLGISPIVIIFGALAGETIAGVPGLLLSVPVLATLRLLYRHAVTVNSGQRPNFWEPAPAIPY